MDSRTQAKLEYWDESYPDYCRTLYADWQRLMRRGASDMTLLTLAARELARNRTLETYVVERLGAFRHPARRLVNDILLAPQHSARCYANPEAV